MKIGAVTAEYNPFHKGHEYQLREFREACGLDYCAVIMSGNFVQRGEPALCDKRTRAMWALQGGADIVIELPVYYAMANAQAFARGAVGTLSGFADVWGFGAETDDTELLKRAAMINTVGIHTPKDGKTYPRAIAEWIRENHGDDISKVFSSPNSTLALEYIRAISKICPDTEIYVTKRKGAAHDSEILPEAMNDDFASASYIRNSIYKGESIASLVPDYVKVEKYMKPYDMDKLIMYKLREMSDEELEFTADVTEGLHKLIKREAMRSLSYAELLTRIKSKRYTMARLKRICLSAMLGITKDMIYAAPMYIHVLGVRESARNVLMSQLQQKSRLPILTKASDYKKNNLFNNYLLKTDMCATDTYALFYNDLPNNDLNNKLVVF